MEYSKSVNSKNLFYPIIQKLELRLWMLIFYYDSMEC